MYCNPTIIRKFTPLLKSNIVVDGFKNYGEDNFLLKIISADSKLNQILSNRYKIDLEPIEKPLGTLSTNKVLDPDNTAVSDPYNKIIGTGTNFSEFLSFGDVLYIKKTKEALQVKDVVSDTEIIINSNANFNAVNSEFWVIPSEIVTCSMFIAIKLILIANFTEQAYNQETIPFFNQFEKECKPIIERLEKGEVFLENFILSNKQKTFNSYSILKSNRLDQVLYNDSQDEKFVYI